MYQAVRNMTRISKLQAAGYIWKVSHANDIKFYAPSDLMPSYIAADKKKAADDKDREYRVMCTQVEKARKELEKCEKDVSVKTDRMTEAQKKYDAAVDRLNMILQNLKMSKMITLITERQKMNQNDIMHRLMIQRGKWTEVLMIVTGRKRDFRRQRKN